ncbi:MAG: LD-carboxypeptidase, partial [Bacteroidetes bacterium]|nr:LD-carboxypeptidase [Bacteroidota bacterium]
MSLRRPNYLKKKDKIAILSTARKISKLELEFAINLLEEWGLEVVLGASIGEEYHQFAGDDKFRAHDFQEHLDRSDIQAILFARGGYGSIRIMDYLDFTAFTKNPKWLIGYSDITIIHALVNNYLGIQSIHASMPINFAGNTKQSLESLRKALFGEKLSLSFERSSLNREGEIKGEIIGGNLSILYSLLGTKSSFNSDNKILFIEDLDEYLYHVDRMFLALKRANKLNQIKALIVGGMSDMKDNAIAFGSTAEEIILEHCKEFDFPICFNAPYGHLSDNQ